jgi:hypothetical protein
VRLTAKTTKKFYNIVIFLSCFSGQTNPPLTRNCDREDSAEYSHCLTNSKCQMGRLTEKLPSSQETLVCVRIRWMRIPYGVNHFFLASRKSLRKADFTTLIRIFSQAA